MMLCLDKIWKMQERLPATNSIPWEKLAKLTDFRETTVYVLEHNLS